MGGKRHRELQEKMKMVQIAEKHWEEKLMADCQQDVNTYKAQCVNRDRNSFQYRRNEAIIQRKEEDERTKHQIEIDQSNRELDDEARNDVAVYIQDCKKRKRLSL